MAMAAAVAYPPRLIHNQKLAREWLAERGIVSAFPKVTEQISTRTINRHALFRGGYNPSLIRYENRWLMAYRWHPDHTPRSALAIAELDEHFNVVKNEQLHCTQANVEDARFFIHNGLLWASYIESQWPDHVKCSVQYGRVTHDGIWRIDSPFKIQYGRNDGESTEKNWAFWEHKGRLMCLYQCAPEQIVLEIEGDHVAAELKSRSCCWKYGPIRAGLSPILSPSGKFIRFFHSRLDNEPPPYAWRYYLGALVMEPEPPFTTILVNQEPLARGSEIDDLGESERSGCAHRKANVIFPAGCVEHEGGWLISAGINDCECALFSVNASALSL